MLHCPVRVQMWGRINSNVLLKERKDQIPDEKANSKEQKAGLHIVKCSTTKSITSKNTSFFWVYFLKGVFWWKVLQATLTTESEEARRGPTVTEHSVLYRVTVENGNNPVLFSQCTFCEVLVKHVILEQHPVASLRALKVSGLLDLTTFHSMLLPCGTRGLQLWTSAPDIQWTFSVKASGDQNVPEDSQKNDGRCSKTYQRRERE